MEFFQYIKNKIIPGRILNLVHFILEPPKYKELRQAVLDLYSSKKEIINEPEIQEGLNYLKRNKFTAYPYRWALKYDNLFPEVLWDPENQSFYTLFYGKKMYFPKRYSKKEIIWITRSILKEQDSCSPHLYLTPGFQPDQNSIVVDAGVAEGNFALSVIEKAKCLFLIECDHDWMESLRLTFAPWKNKVHFIEKYLSDSESETTISIDALIKPENDESYFIKMDIEGYEKKALRGMKNLIATNSGIKLDVCTYHHHNDFSDIQTILKEYDFDFEASKSRILYYHPGEIPEFRKALIRAWRK